MRVIKRVRLPSLDRDPTIKMLRARLNHDHYNALFKPLAFDEIRWTATSSDRRTMIRTMICVPSDPSILVRPRHVHLRIFVEFSHTWIKLQENDGFIRYIGNKG